MIHLQIIALVSRRRFRNAELEIITAPKDARLTAIGWRDRRELKELAHVLHLSTLGGIDAETKAVA
jgi:hypothetical protein